jgi:hypothetical protein
MNIGVAQTGGMNIGVDQYEASEPPVESGGSRLMLMGVGV